MSENLLIGIVGLGYVGSVIERSLSPYATLVTYDLKSGEDYPAQALAKCHFTIICVDSPTRQDGSCNITNVQEAVMRVPNNHILLKSTVPPGTTSELMDLSGKEICFSPEYIAENPRTSTPWGADPTQVPFMIIGGHPHSRNYLLRYLMPIIGANKTVLECSATEAEIIKYMENTYLAMKVAFVNEYFDLCSKFEANWHLVREGWLLDPRVNRSHTAVYEDSRGFGGKCLPKDLSAIIHVAQSRTVDFTLIEAISISNAIRTAKYAELVL